VTTKGASDDGRREIPELTKAEKARWDAIRSTIDAMAKGLAEGTLDAEGLAATTAKLQQTARGELLTRRSLRFAAGPSDCSAVDM
jgi:hypothetical protein